MICKSCKQAGDLLVFVKKDLTDSWIPGKLTIVGATHEMCEYPKSCTCQHVVVLNAIRNVI